MMKGSQRRRRLTAVGIAIVVALALRLGLGLGRKKVSLEGMTEAAYTSGPNSFIPILRVAVSYTYHETAELSSCERLNKRINLATFLVFAVAESGRNIKYDLVFTRQVPSSEDIIQAVGLMNGSRSAKIIRRIFHGRSDNVNIVRASSLDRSDLCHHQRVFKRARRSRVGYQYYFALNDGVRGPFVNSTEAGVRFSRTRFFFERAMFCDSNSHLRL